MYVWYKINKFNSSHCGLTRQVAKLTCSCSVTILPQPSGMGEKIKELNVMGYDKESSIR